MLYTVTDKTGLEISVDFDKSYVLQYAKDCLNDFEEDCFCSLLTVPGERGTAYMTEDEYRQSVLDFVQEVEQLSLSMITDKLNEMYDRKKNGKLAKNRVTELCHCDASTYEYEYANAWTYTQVIYRTTGEASIEIEIRQACETL